MVLWPRSCFSSVICKFMKKFWTSFVKLIWWIPPLPKLLTSIVKSFSPQIYCRDFWEIWRMFCKTLKVTINHRNLKFESWNFCSGRFCSRNFQIYLEDHGNPWEIAFLWQIFPGMSCFVFSCPVTAFFCLPPVDNVILLHLSLGVEFYRTFSNCFS